MAKKKNIHDLPSRWRIFAYSILIPLIVLAFYASAPYWLNHRVRSSVLDAIHSDTEISSNEKAKELQYFENVDFEQVSLHPVAGQERLNANLDQNGIVGNYKRLQWGFWASVFIVCLGLFTIAIVLILNKQASKSPLALLQSYQLSWKIAMFTAIVQLFLLIPLLAYGTFELTVLMADRYYPKVLLLIVLGGLAALWTVAKILLHKVPLEFIEAMSKEVTRAEAPELWHSVDEAARRLQTNPPDHILIGMNLSFYVTELAVIHNHGKTEGRTLFMSLPLLRSLTKDEVVAVIGHELGHFMGDDTRMTRDFYPLKYKVGATMEALSRAGAVGWPSFQFLNLFTYAFSETEQATSRAREFLADQKGASVASAAIAGRALVKYHILVEAFEHGLTRVAQDGVSPLAVSLTQLAKESVVQKEEFWKHLFDASLMHPLDSHPKLIDRLEALGVKYSVQDAQSIIHREEGNAYADWFTSKDKLFTEISEQGEKAVESIREKAQISQADIDTEEGKALLEKHFQPKSWKRKASVSTIILIGVIVLGLVIVAVLANELIVTLIIGAIIAATLVATYFTWKHQNRTELHLTYEGIQYTGWTRPLAFQEVDKIEAVNQNGQVNLTFKLKTKTPPIAKNSILRFERKSVKLNTSLYNEKSVDIAVAICQYFYREKPSQPEQEIV